MANFCTVDVVVKITKSEKNIKRTVESILAQTYWFCCVNILFVVSTKNKSILDILTYYRNMYGSKVKILFTKKHPDNNVVTSNVFENIESDFFLFVKEDDLLEPNAIELLVKSILNENSEIVISTSKNGDKNVKKIAIQKIKTLEKYLQTNYFSTNGLLFKTQYIKSLFKKSDKYMSEFNFLSSCLLNSKKVSFVDKKTYLVFNKEKDFVINKANYYVILNFIILEMNNFCNENKWEKFNSLPKIKKTIIANCFERCISVIYSLITEIKDINIGEKRKIYIDYIFIIWNIIQKHQVDLEENVSPTKKKLLMNSGYKKIINLFSIREINSHENNDKIVCLFKKNIVKRNKIIVN